MYQQTNTFATHTTHALCGIMQNNTTDTGPT